MPLFIRQLVLPGFFLALLGCGTGNSETKVAKVSGKITFKKATYASGGTIRFELASDPTKFASGVILPTGEYSLPNAPIGDNLVSVENTSTTMMMDAKAKAKLVPIAKKYTSPKTSGWKATIKAGSNTENFDLE